MRHHFLWTVVAQSVLGLSLDQLIHEVNGVCGPIGRNVLLLYLRLLGQYLIPYLLSVCPYVGPIPENALEHDDAKGVVIYSHSVIAPTHDLGCHIPGCARCVIGILRLPYSGHAQISDSGIALLVEDYVLWLQVAMDYALVMQKLEAQYHPTCEELYTTLMLTGLLLVEFGVFYEVEAQVAAIDQVHDQVEVLPVLEGIEGVDEELVLEAFQKIEFVHD
jgi:hypothetical protein